MTIYAINKNRIPYYSSVENGNEEVDVDLSLHAIYFLISINTLNAFTKIAQAQKTTQKGLIIIQCLPEEEIIWASKYQIFRVF